MDILYFQQQRNLYLVHPQNPLLLCYGKLPYLHFPLTDGGFDLETVKAHMYGSKFLLSDAQFSVRFNSMVTDNSAKITQFKPENENYVTKMGYSDNTVLFDENGNPMQFAVWVSAYAENSDEDEPEYLDIVTDALTMLRPITSEPGLLFATVYDLGL